MITAVFSNGTADTYKGKRDVKAAWAIIEKATGEIVMSGHSLTAQIASKTATGNIRTYFARGEAVEKPSRYAHQIRYYDGLARERGFANWSAWYAADQIRRTDQAKGYTIEVVEL